MYDTYDSSNGIFVKNKMPLIGWYWSTCWSILVDVLVDIGRLQTGAIMLTNRVIIDKNCPYFINQWDYSGAWHS